MLPLAFNSEGDPFDLPATAVGWRVKRYQPGRGAPEMVYSSDGLPLVIPIEAGIDELRRAVVTPGKYRLDPVDDHHRVIKDADAACVVVCERRPEPTTVNAGSRASRPVGTDPNANAMLMESLRLSVEALRINAELARKVASRFGAMVDAAASLLRAADGAALPVHQPIHVEHDDSDDQEDDSREDDSREDDSREDDGHDGNENEQDIRPPTPPSDGLGAEAAPSGPESPGPKAAPPGPPPAKSSASSPIAPSVATPPSAVSTDTSTADTPPPTSSPTASSSMPQPVASSAMKKPDAAPPVNANASATSPRTTPGAIRNASAAPATSRSSPAKPCPAASPQVIWVAREAESNGFIAPRPMAPVTPAAPPPPPPISSARRSPSSAAMGSPLVARGDDIALEFASTDVEPPPLSTDVVLHFVAILRALRRNEARLVGAAAGELSLQDLRTWLEDLSLMTVPEAVAYVRELIAGTSRSGWAS